MGFCKNIYFFWKKRFQNGRLKKTMFFKTVNSQYFFAKLSGIGPWVSRINWCEGHQCDSTNMVVRLSDIRPKTDKNAKMVPMRSWVNTYAKDCIRLYLFEIVKYVVPHKSYIVPKEVHTIVDMTKRKKETQSRHEFMCNYTLIHNGENDSHKRQFLALGICSQSWKLNNLSKKNFLSNWLVLQAACYNLTEIFFAQ